MIFDSTIKQNPPKLANVFCDVYMHMRNSSMHACSSMRQKDADVSRAAERHSFAVELLVAMLSI